MRTLTHLVARNSQAMKKRHLEQHLRRHGCAFHHSGAKHDFWYNIATEEKTPVPRHVEIKETTAKAICDQLGVPRPDDK